MVILFNLINKLDDISWALVKCWILSYSSSQLVAVRVGGTSSHTHTDTPASATEYATGTEIDQVPGSNAGNHYFSSCCLFA